MITPSVLDIREHAQQGMDAVAGRISAITFLIFFISHKLDCCASYQKLGSKSIENFLKFHTGRLPFHDNCLAFQGKIIKIGSNIILLWT